MLEYQRPETEVTLSEGLRIYYASRPGLAGGRGISPAAREFFQSHDVAHVVFGCTTTLVDEAMVKLWSIFGTTGGFDVLRGYRLPESKEIYKPIGWSDVVRTAIGSLVVLPQVLWRCLRMRKRWPWAAFQAYFEKPLVEIRREFGIRPVRARRA
jgi:hypothetical protein